jgi:DHA3 family macrolide efflux protein-like MFS transporter
VTYKQLFANQPIVKKLSLVQFVAYFGAWFSSVAIYSLLVDFGASASVISLVAAMHFIPAVLISPISGTIIDKIEFKKLVTVLLSIEMIATFMFLNIGSIDDVWLLLLLVFIRMGCASFTFTSQMSFLPQILSQDELQKTNEIHSMIWAFCYSVGMALSGLVVNAYGSYTAFVIDGILFLIALILFVQIKVEVEIKKSNNKTWELIKDGFNYTINNKKVLYLFMLHAVVAFTTYDALITLLADKIYSSIIAVSLAIGYINSLRAFGLMLGPIILSKIANEKYLFELMIMQGISIFCWAYFQDDFYISLFFVFVSGIFTTILWSVTYAMLQSIVEKEYLGRVISYNEMIFMSTSVFVSILIGKLYENQFTLDTITYLLGCGFIVIGIVHKIVVSKK